MGYVPAVSTVVGIYVAFLSHRKIACWEQVVNGNGMIEFDEFQELIQLTENEWVKVGCEPNRTIGFSSLRCWPTVGPTTCRGRRWLVP